MNLKLSLKPNSLMRVENFTKRVRQYFGSVGLVVATLLLHSINGFGQVPCVTTGACAPTSSPAIICAAGTPSLTLFSPSACSMPYAFDADATDMVDTLAIDLTGQVCLDTLGNAITLTSANNPVGDYIHWGLITVPAGATSFNFQINHSDDNIAFAIYHSPVNTCASADFDLDFVTCGIETGTDTLAIPTAGMINSTGYYYVAVWDRTADDRLDDNTDKDDDTGQSNPMIGSSVSCPAEPVCNVSIESVTITDNFDDTYRAQICFTAINGQFSVSDPNALTTPPFYFGTPIMNYPDTICVSKCTDPCSAQPLNCIDLYYNDDMPFSPTVYAISPPSCITGTVDTFDVSGCFDIWPAAPAVNFDLDCDDACFDHMQIVADGPDDGTDIGISDVPDPYTLAQLQTCGAFTATNLANLELTSNDVVTPGTSPAGNPGYKITRLYCITDKGNLPGTSDDETECCTQEFWVDVVALGCSLSCNDLIQISLDQNCEARVTPDMMLEGNTADGCNYYLKLEDEAGNEIGNPLSCDYVGQKIKVSVFSGNNSCWGEILLEDKELPQIPDANCAKEVVVGCNANVPFFDPVRDAGASDNCGLPLQLVILADELDDMDCDETYAATRTFTYVVIDKKGNQSKQCKYIINFDRIAPLCDNNLTDNIGVKRPPNWNNAPGEMMELQCIDANMDGNLDWDADGDGVVDVSYTGAPTIDGNPIYPSSEGHCEVQATFSDTKIQVGTCEQNFKLLRQWTVLNWCNSSDVCQFYQIIKVVDSNPPVTTSEIVDCFEVPTDNAFSCTASFDVPSPTVIFECNDYTWTISYLPSTMVPGFDADPYDVSTCVQPDNYETDGLFIETGITRSSGDNTPITISGLPIGQTWIRYVVTDACGNSSFGASEIRVTENIPPTPVCDEHTTVTLTSQNQARVWAKSFDDGSYDLCGYDVSYDVKKMDEPDSAFKEWIDFDCDDIGDGNMIILKVTDRAGLSNVCMVEASVWGTSKLEWTNLPSDALTLNCGADTSATVLGRAIAGDDCGDPLVTYTNSGSLNNCGYGTLTRTWNAVSKDGKKTISHTQNIEVQSPLVNIVWPNAFVEHDGCGSDDRLSPDIAKFGRPGYNDSDCAMIAVTHDDQHFNFTEGACLKVVRTWTVIDWCNFSANSNNRQTFVQVIKIYNEVKPQANGCAEIINEVLVGDCEVGVTIDTKFTDDCNSLDEMIITYAIDGGARTVGTSYEGTLGYGSHTMIWTAEDRCSNVQTCTFDFMIDEDKEPTPYCLGGITTVVMDNGNVEIWAVDFDRNSFDNCPDNTLTFTMRPRGSSETPTASYRFDCEDLGINEVEIHVADQFGNSDFCITTIKVQSNGDTCDEVTGGGAALISGRVITEYNEAVVDAEVMLENMSPNSQSMISTDNLGAYSFANVPTNTDYEISADKNDDYINGVSTLDIVYIQRHILGLSFLDSPYKVIAADANNSESVSAGDLVIIRKLILGLVDELPDSEAWRFIDANQSFNNQYRPWPFVEKLDLNAVQSDELDNNFIALKVGDVTGDAEPNEVRSAEVRNNNELSLYAVNQLFTKGELVTIPIKASELSTIVGLQTTISFNDDLLVFEGFESNKLDLSKNNFGLHLIDRGIVTMSWNDDEQVSLEENDKVVELTFRALKNGQLTSNISLTSLLTRSEAYTTDYEVLDISLQLVDNDGAIVEGLQLFQNKPNPFDETSIIGFNIPKSGNVSLNVFDITGKKVLTIDDSYTQGYHEISLDKSKLNGSGLYYYQIELEGERAMKKMLLIE